MTCPNFNMKYNRRMADQNSWIWSSPPKFISCGYRICHLFVPSSHKTCSNAIEEEYSVREMKSVFGRKEITYAIEP